MSKQALEWWATIGPVFSGILTILVIALAFRMADSRRSAKKFKLLVERDEVLDSIVRVWRATPVDIRTKLFIANAKSCLIIARAVAQYQIDRRIREKRK